MQNAIINMNGQIVKPEDAKVSIFDRSYLYGDSLYEVVRTYEGQFFGLDEHLERLGKSAQLCHMILSQGLDHYRSEMIRTMAEFAKKNPGVDAYCRIIVSRGEGKIGFGLNCLTTPTLYTIIVLPIEEPTAEQINKGMSVGVVSRWRNPPKALDPAMKSGNYLNNLLAYLEATAEGYDDALLCDYQGFMTEGTTFNVFYAKNGVLVTPPLDVGILDGITRREIIELAHRQGIETREVRFTPAALFEADEVFLTSSVREVFPITKINGKAVGKAGNVGKPGPLTLKLRKDFQAHVMKSLAKEASAA